MVRFFQFCKVGFDIVMLDKCKGCEKYGKIASYKGGIRI